MIGKGVIEDVVKGAIKKRLAHGAEEVGEKVVKRKLEKEAVEKVGESATKKAVMKESPELTGYVKMKESKNLAPGGMTKEKFNSYTKVQHSGVTNMFNVPIVQSLSGLKRDEIFDIMKNYGKYADQFGK